MDEIINIFILSTLAGSTTGLGAAIILLVKEPSRRLLGFLMGMAGGVMITLAFLELFLRTWELSSFQVAAAAFTVGAILMLFLDYLFPHLRFGIEERGLISPKLSRAGALIAIGITIHNVPEGIAVGAGFLHLPEFGMFIAIAIALHNIPEGIAIAAPLYAGGARKLAALEAASFSGLAEPVGAVAAAFFLKSFAISIAPTFAFAAGVLTFIVLDELIPPAHEEMHHHFTSLGVIVGAFLVFLLKVIWEV